MAFAGITITAVGEHFENYTFSVSIISSDGSTIGTKSSTSAITISSLAESFKSVLSQLTEGKNTRVQKYTVTIPPALPADKIYEVHSALKGLKLLPSGTFDPVPITHGEAYALGTSDLGKNTTSTILFVDIENSSTFSSTFLESTDVEGKRENKALHHGRGSELNSDAIKKVISAYKPTDALDRIIFHSLPGSSTQIESNISDVYPSSTIIKSTPEAVSQWAARSLYLQSLLPKPPRILAQYAMQLPVSIASPTGSTISLVPSGYRVPCEQYITLTTSRDDQRTATIRLLLGNHLLAKHNLERDVIVVRDLPSAKKGDIKIRVTIEVTHLNGWRKAAKFTVSHTVGGGQESPNRTYLFPRFFSDLPEDADERYEVVSSKAGDIYEPYSDEIVGELPE